MMQLFTSSEIGNMFSCSAQLCRPLSLALCILLGLICRHQQAIGKTAEAGLFGFGLLILYWKTRNIWACAIAHGLNDFFVDFQSGLFVNEETSHGYIYEGDTAIKSIIMYCILSVINIIYLSIIWKKVGKTIDFKKIREEW